MDTHPTTDRDLATAKENLRQLQAHVDGLHAENKMFRERIEHLHTDRETLRTRNHRLEEQLVALRSTKTNRLRQFIGDLVRARIGPREFGERFRQMLRPLDPVPPLPRSSPAFSTQQAEYSSLIPQIDFPEPIPRRGDLTVAGIMDDFSRIAFSYEFNYVPITPENWRSELGTVPDLVIVESAFAGNHGAWVNEIAGFRERQTLTDLITWCRERHIPTVFWNKEDPANFEWFISAASAFDWVFTVDEESVPRYRSELGHGRVDVLPFAAQPAINFPPPSDDHRTRQVAFAGSFYAQKHAGRREQMKMILEPATEFDLDIFDRMAAANDPRFAWPERYREYIRGSLSYAQTTEAYRRYRVFLNINTVTGSPTMCARRVFELLASGTAVVSGPSVAIERMVPAGAIVVAHSQAEARDAIAHLLGSAATRISMSADATAWIEAGNTYGHRVDQILARVGLVS